MADEHENTSADDQALADEWAAALEETGDAGQDDIDALAGRRRRHGIGRPTACRWKNSAACRRTMTR